VGRIIKAFRAAANDAGLEGVTPHILRHTAAVWMAAAGVSMARIAQYLGHDNSRTTEAIYARFAPEHLVDASKALEW
jgi:integrase